MTVYKFDGTMNGIFTCVYRALSSNEFPIYLTQEEPSYETVIYDEVKKIATDEIGVKKIISLFVGYTGEGVLHDVYYAFKSDSSRKHSIIFSFIKKTIERRENISLDFTCPEANLFYELVKTVSDEANRVKKSIKFTLRKGFYVASVNPDDNVLELIAAYFVQKFNGHPFMIIDSKRKIAVCFNGLERRTIKVKNSCGTSADNKPSSLETERTQSIIFSLKISEHLSKNAS